MTEKSNDGGPAFPTEPNTQPGFYAHHGMSLRDWFAGQALTAYVDLVTSADFSVVEKAATGEGYSGPIEGYMAFRAYRVADAMLKERSK